MFSLKSMVPTDVFKIANSRDATGPTLIEAACFSDNSTIGVSADLSDVGRSEAVEEIRSFRSDWPSARPMKTRPQNRPTPPIAIRIRKANRERLDWFLKKFKMTTPSDGWLLKQHLILRLGLSCCDTAMTLRQAYVR